MYRAACNVFSADPLAYVRMSDPFTYGASKLIWVYNKLAIFNVELNLDQFK